MGTSQRDAYEKTFRALKQTDAEDDEGWLPGSRDVRRRGVEFCRANGYEVRNDEWLGV